MRARTAYAAAVVGAALLAIAGCSSTATADDDPTPTQRPTTTEPTDEPTQDATEDAPYVDPDGTPMTEDEVEYAYDGELGWGETYGLLDLMWSDLTPENQTELCDTRYEQSDEAAYEMLQEAIQEHEEDWVLDRYGVYDFLNDYC